MKFKIQNKAFSFVEVMVAVFLVSVGLLAALKLLTGGLSATMDSRNQLIGSLLAQEGTELVRSMRDSNWTDGNPSFNNIKTDANFVIASTNGQKTDYAGSTLYSGRPNLYRTGDGFYVTTTTASTLSDKTLTRFSRRINIYDDGDTNQRKVLSMVTWNGRSTNPFTEWNTPAVALTKDNLSECNTVNKCAYAEDVLTNWGE